MFSSMFLGLRQRCSCLTKCLGGLFPMNMFQGVETTNQKIGRSAMIETYLQLGVNGGFSIDQISGRYNFAAWLPSGELPKGKMPMLRSALTFHSRGILDRGSCVHG